ncbi:MAG: hypothetical protein H0W73_00350 [Bacteroidetes bacterium]|nr:hypothetical protein [Bacteroidota bacterium]
MKNIQNIKFDFLADYKIEDDNFKNLTAVQKQQLIACVPLYLIESDAENMDVSDIVNLFREEDGGWAEACLYHILDTDSDEIAFDFWVFNEDSGTIFEHNTINNIEIYMNDYNFELARANAFNKKLPENFVDVLQQEF